jgi:hypothetical protein
VLKQNPGGNKFNDVRDVETVVTRMQITQGKDFYQKGLGKLVKR